MYSMYYSSEHDTMASFQAWLLHVYSLYYIVLYHDVDHALLEVNFPIEFSI